MPVEVAALLATANIAEIATLTITYKSYHNMISGLVA